jgi:predicted O-linked N-acetylglucosamine transferase (SPINDLY family)
MEDLRQILRRGIELHQRGLLNEAEPLYLRVLQDKPDQFEARHFLGVLRLQQGRFGEAVASFDIALLARPDHLEAHYLRGNALAALGRYSEAVESYDKAIAAAPSFVEAMDNRGNALALLGRPEEALASYERALALRPDYAGAWYNRGNVLLDLGRPEDAIASYERVLALVPQHAPALNGRGIALHALGRFEEALASYRAALTLDPNNPEILYNHGGAEQELGLHEEALASFARALALRPDYAQAHYARAASLHATNRWRESVASYERALALKPDDPATKLALCMAELPILYDSKAEIVERRAAYERRLRAFAAEVAAMPHPGALAAAVGQRQPFFLTYQGRNDRELQTLYGETVCRIMADAYPPAKLPPPPASNEPFRVGFVSGFFRSHANWRMPIEGWLGQLDRNRFRIFGYHTGAETDAETGQARALCERFVQGPLSIERWREEVAADAPHVLIYPEVGMNAAACQLAAQRLAPVQCNSWGHPTTSGFPTLDYFLSSDLMEPADAQEHYSERLVRLPNLSVYCGPVEKPAPSLTRQELGMCESAFVYWCGQSLFKYLPQHDEVFPRIAREVGDCQFVFVEYPRSARVTEMLRTRLARAFAAFGLRAEDHCLILSRLDQERFISATGLADAFLDSIGWSGCNSTLEALACDLPIVTLTGALMRGRHSAAMLEMMNMTATTAATVDEYVGIAVRLARNPGWHAEVRGTISASKNRISGDAGCIAGLEAFLDGVARKWRAPGGQG